jgi:hypothetical protein
LPALRRDLDAQRTQGKGDIMTDLEMTKLCAEAMGIPHKISTDRRTGAFVEIIKESDPGNGGEFDPLHDDAQAMALVKKFRLEILPDDLIDFRVRPIEMNICTSSDDLNRAIVECVAKMQKAKAA